MNPEDKLAAWKKFEFNMECRQIEKKLCAVSHMYDMVHEIRSIPDHAQCIKWCQDKHIELIELNSKLIRQFLALEAETGLSFDAC